MKHASFFSGFGGFDLAAEWMGWENVLHCEKNTFCRKILSYYWPNAISYEDIKKTDFIIYRGSIDILTGGFPCQPYSTAGKRLGSEDERHLWPQKLRGIREIQPPWVVGENVRGLTNWNGGLVFDEIQADLEAIGYEVTPFILPACAVNAPHRRERVWFIAYSAGFRRLRDISAREILQREEPARRKIGASPCKVWINTSIPIPGFEKFPTQPAVCGGNDGLPSELDGIAISDWIKESLKGFGNAIVPQEALQIFKAIEQYNNL